MFLVNEQKSMIKSTRIVIVLRTDNIFSQAINQHCYESIYEEPFAPIL